MTVDKFLITRRTANAITGSIMVTTSPRVTCPLSCAFRKGGNGPLASLCYAEHGALGGFVWTLLDRTPAGRTIMNDIRVHDFAELLYAIRSQPREALWRHNIAGDLPSNNRTTIDRAALRAIVGSWYRVTKKINGRFYDYWQRTCRVGKSVKTENKYIGPAGTAKIGATGGYTPAATGTLFTHRPSSKSSLTSLEPEISPTAPCFPEEALQQIRPFTDFLDGKDRRRYERQRTKERAEDEAIQYGHLSKRIKRHKARYRAAKSATRGIKSLNPFIALTFK
jgi:hypothetical protein